MQQRKLIELRAERNWTQRQLAEKAGVSDMTIYKMEHALPVSQESAEKGLAIFGVTLEEVAGLVLSKPQPERINRGFVQKVFRPRRTDYQFHD